MNNLNNGLYYIPYLNMVTTRLPQKSCNKVNNDILNVQKYLYLVELQHLFVYTRENPKNILREKICIFLEKNTD